MHHANLPPFGKRIVATAANEAFGRRITPCEVESKPKRRWHTCVPFLYERHAGPSFRGLRLDGKAAAPLLRMGPARSGRHGVHTAAANVKGCSSSPRRDMDPRRKDPLLRSTRQDGRRTFHGRGATKAPRGRSARDVAGTEHSVPKGTWCERLQPQIPSHRPAMRLWAIPPPRIMANDGLFPQKLSTPCVPMPTKVFEKSRAFPSPVRVPSWKTP